MSNTKLHNFQYVTAKQLSPVKQDLIQIINSVQNQVRKDFTFQFYFVGSVERNMVIYDVKSNVGFDFDVDIYVDSDECGLSAKEIKTKIRFAFEKADWIKNNEYWQEMRDLYLDKKNHNNDHHKHSRSIYAETIHEICQKYGYYNKKFLKSV